jgi:hypothetical protein
MEMNRDSSGKFGNNAPLILLITIVLVSSAIRDLNSLKELTVSLGEFTAEWLDAGLTTVDAKGISLAENSCTNEDRVQGSSTDEFHWSGLIGPGKAIEIKGVNGDVKAEPALGNDVEVIANKRSRGSDPNAVGIQVVEHAGGVTICAIYPSDNPGQPNTCEPGEERGRRNSSATISLQHHDVRVDFLVRVPAGVAFAGRTINGEISASSLRGNVVSRTVNGSISISTSGYAEGKTVNGEIAANLGNTNWSGPLEFTTINGGINLKLPATVNTEVNAETLNGEISSDFPLTLPGIFSRKRLSGTIGSGGRKLTLKTLNGSIHLSRAG